ncbi:RNB domain-containing protein [Mycena indigotica]|uniref:RNB domain-containing protein n=1 Tax=Mycena indigotica TaxID=2126181 RepID=A0A8H6T7Q5_9AGAR|nr:RNB domain-containing protein [Mycena indigotica]KAF7312450.1 RNB domain-containing protein [Mycena indigotica]
MLRAWSQCRRLPRRRYSSTTGRLTDAELMEFDSLADELITTAALPDPPAGWTSIHKEEKRYATLIKTRESARMASLQKTTFNSVAPTESVNDDTPFIPGTFVELRRNEVSSTGVVLGEKKADSRSFVVVLTASGEVWETMRNDIFFASPNLVIPAMAERCGTETIAEDKAQLNARVKVLQSIREIQNRLDLAVKNTARRRVDIYAATRARQSDQWATTNLAQATSLLYSDPTLVQIFATHVQLMSDSEHFEPAADYLVSGRVYIRPHSHLATLNKIQEWRRLPDGPIQSFVSRARSIIEANKQRHEATRNDTPSSKLAKHVWTHDDQQIIDFLRRALQPRRSVQEDPYALGRNFIIRELYPSVPATDDVVLHQTLVDLGVYAPWQDLVSLRDRLELDQREIVDTSPVERLVRRTLSINSAPAKREILGPEDLYRTDPLDHLRHDFAQMPIYVIDSPDAQELDDGISIEPVANEPDSYWVHVHIADPASTLPPTHTLSMMAAKKSETAYFSHRTWPLFPHSLTKSGLSGFSLTEGKENRVLTFSSKVNVNGDLKQSVVRPGIARNLIRFSYDQVTVALDGAPSHIQYPLLSEPPPALQYAPIPEAHMANLRLLRIVCQRVIARRLKTGVVEANNSTPSIINFASPVGITSPATKPTEFSGFPTFDVSVQTYSDLFKGSAGIVAECMKLACRTASRWCHERDVDVLRRTAMPVEGTAANLKKLRAMRDERGYVNPRAYNALTLNPPTAILTLEPGPHWTVGALEGEGYTRATSPLRRFSDLLVHYQIHSALLGKDSFFSRDYMHDYKLALAYQDRQKKTANKHHVKYWVLMALKRYMEGPRQDALDLNDLSATVSASVRVNIVHNTLQSPVDIPALGVQAMLKDVPKAVADSWTIGAELRVRVKEVQLGLSPTLIVTPKSM